MLESKSAASVSPNLTYKLANECTYTFNFQPDGQLVIIGTQGENSVVGSFSPQQVAELKEAFLEFLEKRGTH
jgi:hypothetical protein